MSAPHVTHWQAANPPTEELLMQIMIQQGLNPIRWSNRAGDTYSPHKHHYLKILYVTQGSITFTLPLLKQKIELNVGDRLELPANTVHSAQVGVEGVTCLEGYIETSKP